MGPDAHRVRKSTLIVGARIGSKDQKVGRRELNPLLVLPVLLALGISWLVLVHRQNS